MSDEKVNINNGQFMAIVVCTMWPTVINYGSGILARQVGHDMWISGAFSVLNTLVLIYIAIRIARNYPEKTIVEYSQELLWTIPGKIVGLLLTIYFLVAAANTVSMYIHHLTDFLLPETPFLVVTIFHCAVLTYLVNKGPEVIGRMGVIGFGLAILFHILVFMASLPEVDAGRLTPLFDYGFLPVYIGSFSVDSFTGINVLLIPMLFPLVLRQKKAFRSAATGVLIGGFFFVFYFIVELMVMGPQVVALMRIASMDFVRSIQITQYLHRFESFMVALWYWSMLVQAGILTYSSKTALIQTIGVKKSKTKTILVFLYGIALVVLTYLLANDRVLFLKIREEFWPYFAVPVQYGLTFLLLLALLMKKAFSPNKK